MSKNWKILDSQIVFEPHIRMRIRRDKVRLPNNRVVDDFFLWVEGDVVLIVPVTKDGKFILVKQYKHGAGKEVIEFPAGMLDHSEEPDHAAERELQEETGYKSDNIELLARLYNHPTKVVGDIHVYLALNVVPNGRQNLDENEDIEVLQKTKEEILEMIYTGQIFVTGTVSSFFLALKKLNKN